jgi:hypothetical protein
VGLEPTIPASELAKTVHALDRSATVTGTLATLGLKMETILSKKFQSFVSKHVGIGLVQSAQKK